MTPPACTTWSSRSSTTRSTRRWPGYCSRIDVTIHSDNSVTVEDDGRGIPVDLHKEEGRSAAEVVMTELHAGGKFDKNSYKVSGGLHGVGVSVVNALSRPSSSRSSATARSGTRLPPGRPRRSRSRPSARPTKTGHQGPLQAGPRDLRHPEFNFDTLAQRLRELSFLNRGVHIRLQRRADRQGARVRVRGRHRLVRRAPEPQQDSRSTPSRSTSIDSATTAPAGDGRGRAAVERRLPGARSTASPTPSTTATAAPTCGLQGGADAHGQRLRARRRAGKTRRT